MPVMCHARAIGQRNMNSLESAIARAMSAPLKAAGFALKRDWNSFVRSTAYGHDQLVIVDQGTAAPGPRHHEISIHCAVRHDAVEHPWNTLGLVYGDAQLHTATLVLGFPRGMAAPRLKVFAESRVADVARVASEGIAIFREIAVPFFERFSHLHAVEEFVNARPLEDFMPYTVGLAMEHRAFRSMILAKLVNPNRYASIREQFLARNIGMFPVERRLAMLAQVDAMQLSTAR
jgi:hypothetical protein